MGIGATVWSVGAALLLVIGIALAGFYGEHTEVMQFDTGGTWVAGKQPEQVLSIRSFCPGHSLLPCWASIATTLTGRTAPIRFSWGVSVLTMRSLRAGWPWVMFWRKGILVRWGSSLKPNGSYVLPLGHSFAQE